MKNIVVSGGCGFIGSALITKLMKKPDLKIRVIDNFSVGSVEQLLKAISYPIDQSGVLNWDNRVEVVKGDITCLASMRRYTDGASGFVHLAANTGVAPSVEDPLFDCFSNVIGTVNCLESCRINGINRFVFASSGAPLGEQDPPISETCVPKPVSPYGASKLSGEGYCSAYHGSFGLETVALRFGNVYGPGSVLKSSAVAKFIKLAINGMPIEIYGDGEQTRDFVYIDDLSDAIIKALEVPNIGGEIFQIATSSETTVNELIQNLSVCFNEIGIEFPQTVFGEARLGDVKRNFSDTSKAQHLLNWNAKVKLKDGLMKTIEYFRSGEVNE
jgi:UDP-glucose 4-epimerase